MFLHRHSSYFAIVLVMGCMAEDARAQKSGDALYWTALPTPPSGSVRALVVVHDGAILAGTTGGVYASRDSGTSWKRAGLDSTNVDALLVTRTGTLLLGSYREGLFRSVDNGTSWHQAGFERNVYLFGIVQDRDGTVYLSAADAVDSTTASGVFLSTDDGNTWTSAGLKHRLVFSLSIPLPGHLYAGTDSGLFVSRDKGRTWTHTEQGLPTTVPVSAVAAFGPTLLAATSMRQDAHSDIAGDGVFRSDDGGLTWTRADRGMPSRTSVRALLVSGDTVLAAAGNAIAGGGSGIYRSVKMGDWQQVGLDGAWVRGLARLPGGRLLATANDAAMFRSDDGGHAWVASAQGFANWETQGVAVSSAGRLYASSLKGTFSSRDGGANWKLSPGLSPEAELVSTPDALLGGGLGGRVYRLGDDSVTWSIVGIARQSDPVYDLKVDAHGRLLAALSGPNGGLHVSDDQGSSWRALGVLRPKVAADWQGVTSVATTASGAIIASTMGTLQRAGDGREFEIVRNHAWAFSLAACGHDTVFAAVYQRGLLRSTDDGRTWTPLTEQLRAQSRQKGYLTLTSVLCLDTERILVGSLGDGVFLSEDRGITWTSISTGLRSGIVWSFATEEDGSIVAATNAGVHRLAGLSRR